MLQERGVNRKRNKARRCVGKGKLSAVLVLLSKWVVMVLNEDLEVGRWSV
jgi:hypothetical protein